MATRILASDLLTHVGQHVRIEGWIHRRRRLAKVTFLVVRDRSGLAQVVVDDEATRSLLDELGEETVVRVDGVVAGNAKAPNGVEVTTPDVSPLSEPAATPPVELWRPGLAASLPTLLDHAPITWRHPTRRAVWQLAAASVMGFRTALDERGFTEIHTPKIVGGSTESGANVFELDYFGGTAYLAQSPQFYKQTMVGVFERVYEVGPVFRAEPHDTARHLAEYVSLDAEVGFITDHRDVLAVLRNTLAGMLDAARTQAGDALGVLDIQLPNVPEQIPTIDFQDALALVGASPGEPDLAPEHERAIGEWALREHGSDFVAVEGYPMAKRPFYTHPRPRSPIASNSFDLLFRGLELVTGGQRLHRYSDYTSALAKADESPEAYASYLAAFEHGMPPHGGFAIGLERWVARLVEAANVRETTLFPRDLTRLAP